MRERSGPGREEKGERKKRKKTREGDRQTMIKTRLGMVKNINLLGINE